MQHAQSDDRLDAMIQKIQSGSMRMTETDAISIAGQLYAKGRYKQAENICRQLIRHKPNIADAHSILGIALNAQGQRKEALASLRKAVKLAPQKASYRSNLGEVQRLQGNLADATVSLTEAIDLDPRNPRAHNNLGIIRFESRAYEDAAQSYRTAIALKPDFAEAYNNLGNALRRTGDRAGAIDAYQNALAIRETYPEAYANLGTLLREAGKLDQAEHALRKAIRQKPDYTEAYYNLAFILYSKKADLDALRQLNELFQRDPRHERGLVLTARIQMRLNNWSTAEQACRLTLQNNPNNVEALSVLGYILHETNRYAEGREALEKALSLAPNFAEAINYYGIVLKSLGDFDAARDQLRRSLDINPALYGAYANISDLIDYSQDKALFDQLEKLVQNSDTLSDEMRLPLHYAYGRALEHHGRYENAMEHYIKGGQLKRRQLSYDEKEAKGFFAQVKKAFPAALFRDRPFAGHMTDRLVFIVGMPRSGSTLVEQIISGHEDVYGAGEVKCLNDTLLALRDRFPSLSTYPAMIEEMSAGQWDLVAKGYEQAIFRNAGDAKMVTDKLLTNFFFIGMINILFPNAKIIQTRRDPVDTCLSTFTKLFKDDMPHSYDMVELGRYYRQYDALMKHWEKVLPEGVMKTVYYEDVVADTEQQAKDLIEFLGLDWNPGLLDFHKSSRPVKTASVTQVRKPIYTTSVKRAEKYGDAIKPLVNAIGTL
ncbi:sulfotransferase family protein [Altericroceibacterium spongiae]|uniref:Sulfotransferase family protein n=1 Tax=Altericroceibacterium spongiae TaxID=2320269 RepID=A0A420EIU1_9SPHN|nr:tetratricopeptide repeat-containing sulfotransferase family protein [Altericroceibacterium spongiae]RKF20563.1 sulfotransferase family protein [Altericroceibacterium spongiae]